VFFVVSLFLLIEGVTQWNKEEYEFDIELLFSWSFISTVIVTSLSSYTMFKKICLDSSLFVIYGILIVLIYPIFHSTYQKGGGNSTHLSLLYHSISILYSFYTILIFNTQIHTTKRSIVIVLLINIE